MHGETAGNDGRLQPDAREVMTILADGGQSPLDRILEALASERRRYLLYYLADHDPADIEQCATAVAARETGRSPADIPKDEREAVETLLYHQHLPKLANLGIIEYDQRSGAVRSHNPPPHFEEFLRLAREIETD